MKSNEIFTIEELETAKELAYMNWKNEEETEIGFEYEGQWITNPFIEESGRFELNGFEDICNHYGKDSVVTLIRRLLKEADTIKKIYEGGCNNE